MRKTLEKARMSEKGITLIALVITIIVLLILAGISISMLSGENSILTKAGDAATLTEIARIGGTSKFSLFKWSYKQICE